MGVYIETEENKDEMADKNRTYIVTAKFKMSGFLPDRVSEEHIKSNIQSAIQDAVSEIALSSEYYDDEDDEEWGIYLEDNAKIDLETMRIRICELPFCEHCGEGYTDFGIEIFDGVTSWCLDCYLSDGGDRLSKEDIEEIRAEFKKLKRKHLLIELHKLEHEDEE